MHYFISNDAVSVFTTLDAIRGLDISTSIPFNINDRDGFLLDRESDVEKIASTNSRTWNHSNSNYDHIRIVQFSDVDQTLEREELPDIVIPDADPEDLATESPFKVTIHENWDGHHQNKFKELAEQILISVLDRNLLLSVPHGFPHGRMTDEDFEIHIWSTIDTACDRTEKGVKPPKKAWGIPVTCRQDPAFPSTGREDCIRFTSGQYTVAELYDNKTLYIHHDICHTGVDEEIDLFMELLTRVRAEIETPELAEKIRIAEQKRNLKNFVNLCVKGQLGRIKEIEDNLRHADDEVAKLTEKFTKVLQGRESLRIEADALRPSVIASNARFKQQFEQLMAIENVVKVRIPEENKLLIYTDTLYCPDDRTGMIHEIGKFKITINATGRDGGVKWKNQTRLVKNAYSTEGMQAPHIYGHGGACLGNVSEAITKCLAKHDFYTLTILAIKFVESANTKDSAGEHINKWPVYVPKEVAAETTQATAEVA